MSRPPRSADPDIIPSMRQLEVLAACIEPCWITEIEGIPRGTVPTTVYKMAELGWIEHALSDKHRLYARTTPAGLEALRRFVAFADQIRAALPE